MHGTMLQLAIYDNMHMCSIDTVGTFLYQEYFIICHNKEH